MSERYTFTVLGLSFAFFKAHETKPFTISVEKGQTSMEPESVANLLKLLRAALDRFQLLSE
jgi:hypothetical protein